MSGKIALAQIDPTLGDIRVNIKKHIEYARRAKEGGSDLVVFPELSLTGYTLRDLTAGVALRPPNVAELNDLVALSHDLSILVGGVEESREFGLYNAAFLIERGEVSTVHRKIYPPTYGMFEEMRYFDRGEGARAFESRIGRIGVLICEDLWHLPLPYLLAQDGAQVIICMAASPTRLSAGDDARLAVAQMNTEHHRAYARLLSVYLVFCNRVGFEDGINFWGGSEVIDPAGEIVVQASLHEEQIVQASLHHEEIRRARQASRHFLDDDPWFVIRELCRIRNSRS